MISHPLSPFPLLLCSFLTLFLTHIESLEKFVSRKRINVEGQRKVCRPKKGKVGIWKIMKHICYGEAELMLLCYITAWPPIIVITANGFWLPTTCRMPCLSHVLESSYTQISPSPYNPWAGYCFLSLIGQNTKGQSDEVIFQLPSYEIIPTFIHITP